MPRTEFATELGRLYAVSQGHEPDDAFFDAVASVLDLNGIRDDDHIPAYFRDGIARIARRDLLPEGAELPPHERGHSWILRDVAELIPGAVFRDEPTRDLLEVPALGAALVVERATGAAERYAVLPMAETPASRGLTVLGTFSPTPEQVRQWASDPDLRFTAQDEDDAISHESYAPLLLELVDDPAGPKRRAILGVLDRIATRGVLFGDPDGLARLARLRDLAANARLADVRSWAHGLDRLHRYATGRGPVTESEAREVALALLVGTGAAQLEQVALQGWWRFAAMVPGLAPRAHLYVHGGTGNLVVASSTPGAAMLDAYAALEDRTAPLRAAARGSST